MALKFIQSVVVPSKVAHLQKGKATSIRSLGTVLVF